MLSLYLVRQLKHLSNIKRYVREVAETIGLLGGHLNRRRDGLPGWQTLWLGMKKLTLLVEGMRHAQLTNKFG